MGPLSGNEILVKTSWVKVLVKAAKKTSIKKAISKNLGTSKRQSTLKLKSTTRSSLLRSSPNGAAGFGPDYFKAYAGSGTSYNKVWRDHTFADELVEQFKSPGAPRLKKICVLGIATGKVGVFFEKKLGVKVWGCESSAWAYGRIPAPLKRRVKHEDMRVYVDRLLRHRESFDLVYSNSLVYLDLKDLPSLLKKLSKVAKILHFNSSFLGKACPDPHRKILKSYAWWDRKFSQNGFKALKGARGHRTYLWVSKHF